MTKRFEEEDLAKIHPISIETRDSKVRIGDFADPAAQSLERTDLAGMFPRILKGEALGNLVTALRRARDDGREILWMIGAHVLKTGLSLYVNALMEQRYITTIATTGSATVHDLELAFFGETSEDVAVELPKGRFGMAKETSSHFASACDFAVDHDLGLGGGLGGYIVSSDPPHARFSVFAGAQRAGIPAT
ncbi:MAG: hypothetical protein JSW50_13510, partial [Candidatus Latescibacterota bacterium]